MTIVPPVKHSYFHPDFLELQSYLGSAFRLDWCDATDNKGEKDATDDRYKDNDDFIRNSLVFCYQNIGLTAQGIHRPYLAKLFELTADRHSVSVLDFGAGGGQVGLGLHTLGYKVSFADLYSQSFNWLTWRLYNRRLNLPVYCLDMTDVEIPRHDVVICFDVIEHCEPEEQLRLIHQCANYGTNVFMNLIADDKHDKLHFPVDVEALTQYIGDNWKTWAKDYYEGRQRLLIYGEGVRTSE